MIVVTDAILQALDAVEPVGVEELGFEHGKEAFHGGVVETVAFAGHALSDVPRLQPALIGRHLVVPSLIGVQDRPVFALEDRKSVV